MDIIFRTTAIYLFILIVLRVTTRRILRSATPLDLVVVFLFGGFTLPALLNQDMSLTAAALGMSTVAGLHFGLSRLRMRWPPIGSITEGTAIVIFDDGVFDDHQMRRSRITKQDVAAEMRQRGLASLDEVRRIVVEHNGAISVLGKT